MDAVAAQSESKYGIMAAVAAEIAARKAMHGLSVAAAVDAPWKSIPGLTAAVAAYPSG